MNKQNHIDQHVQDLLNGGIDGELSAEERKELDQLLNSSATVRDLNDELSAFCSLMQELPEREPPQYLHNAITRQVRLPLEASTATGKNAILGAWLPTHWLRVGFGFAAGLAITVGVYEMGSQPISPEDAANMVGTVIQNPDAGQGTLLDSIKFDTGLMRGKVELREKDHLLLLDVRLNSDVPMEVTVDFAGKGLEFEGISRMQNQTDVVSVDNGVINIASNGEQHYAIKLRRDQDVHEPFSTTLALGFFANNTLVYEAEIGKSR